MAQHKPDKSEQEPNYFTPMTYEQAINCKDKEKWKQAMTDHLKLLNDLKAWELTTCPRNRKAIKEDGCTESKS